MPDLLAVNQAHVRPDAATVARHVAYLTELIQPGVCDEDYCDQASEYSCLDTDPRRGWQTYRFCCGCAHALAARQIRLANRGYTTGALVVLPLEGMA